MKEYLLGLIICSVTAAVICYMSPSDNLARHQKFVAGLCVICVGISPVTEVIGFIREFDIKLYVSGGEYDEYEQKWEDYLESYGEEAVRDYVALQLRENFGVEAKKISVACGECDGEICIEKIYVELPQNAIFKDTAKIEVYFERIFGCDVISTIA